MVLLPNNTLQSSLGESSSSSNSNAYNAKGGCAEIIRTMLREQKKECAALHANPIFREFRNDKKHSRDRAGRAVEQGPPVIDDLDAEGQSRLLGVIKSAAQENCHTPVGVWASFGSPYACLGTPVDLDSSLPVTSRRGAHEQQGSRQLANTCGRLSGRHVKATSSTSSNMPTLTGTSASGSSTAAAAAAAIAAAAAAANAAAAGGGCPTEGTTRLLGTAVISEADAVQLLRHKFVLRNSTLDKVEASFPAGPLKQAKGRRIKAKTRSGSYYDKGSAAADASDAVGSYGFQKEEVHHKPGRDVLHLQLAAVTAMDPESRHLTSNFDGSSTAVAAAGTVSATASTGCVQGAGDPGSVFITQRAGVAAGGGGGDTSRSKGRGPGGTTTSLTSTQWTSTSTTVTAPCSTAALVAAAAAAALGTDAQEGEGPRVHHLRELTDQKPGEHNPVIDWHNQHIQVRQAERTKLQQQLWQRAEGRQMARTCPEAVAALSHVVTTTVAATGGLATAAPKSGGVCSPFTRTQHLLDTTTAASRQRAAAERSRASQRPLRNGEVSVLQHFYECLCLLVEQQRLSDPLSLMLVHKVKSLLEHGVFLHRPLLEQVVHHVADFVTSCGLVRYNPFALPLLTFIRKCTGVSAQELHGLAASAGITAVLYPARAAGAAITASSQEAATIQAALAAAATSSSGGAESEGRLSVAGAGRSSRPGSGEAAAAGGGLNVSSRPGTAAAAAGGSHNSSLQGPAGGHLVSGESPAAADAAAINAAATEAQDQLVEAIALARQTAAGRNGSASSSSSSIQNKRVPGVAGSSGGGSNRRAGSAGKGRPGSAVSFADPAAAGEGLAGALSSDDDEPLPELGGPSAASKAKAELEAANAEWRASRS